MPAIRLPIVEAGKTDKDTMNNVLDTVNRYRKELQFLLSNLDSQNIKSIDADVTQFKNLNVEATVISNTVITNNLYAELGRIARLTVDRLLTEDIVNQPSTMSYIDIENQSIKFIDAVHDTELPDIQYTDTDGTPLYYKEDGTMTTENTGTPVMVHQYNKLTKLELSFEDVSGIPTPIITLGAGDGVLPMSAKAQIYKDSTGLILKYYKSNTANEVYLKIGDNGIEGLYHVLTSAPVDTFGNDGELALVVSV